MKELTSTDEIITWLTEQATQKNVVDASDLLRAAHTLNLFLGDEQEKLFVYQQNYAVVVSEHIAEGKSVAMAKQLAQSTDGYRILQSQKAKIDRIIEFVRIAKLNARIKSDEYKGTM